MTRAPRRPPDHSAALAQYRRRAAVYDLELALFEPVRRRAVERLVLRPGDLVLDVGCGTGLSLPLLQPEVGPTGRIVGIEQSPEMMALARERVARNGWHNVALIEAPAEAARLKGHADAALFHFTHDILREPLAIANVLSHLRPGAHVVACGLQWARFWAWPVNLFVLGAARHSVTSLAGLGSPWSLLAPHLQELRVDTMVAGGVFIASGVLRQSPQQSPTTTGDSS
ncbi:MAG: methyltransferase domain-containing protein [Burkholderiales bacterium]